MLIVIKRLFGKSSSTECKKILADRIELDDQTLPRYKRVIEELTKLKDVARNQAINCNCAECDGERSPTCQGTVEPGRRHA